MVTAVMLTLVQIAPAFSQGESGDALEIFRGWDGAYEVVVSVVPEVPTVGTVHISIGLLVADTSTPVTDAQITIVATDPDGIPAYQTRALNSPDAAWRYEANITFESQGTWTLSAVIQSAVSGDAAVVFPLDLGPQPLDSSYEGALVFLVVLGVLVGGFIYIWRSNRWRHQPIRSGNRTGSD